MTLQHAESQRHSVNFLQSASNLVITGGTFIGVQEKSADSLAPLYARVSPHAIFNTGGRADIVRCHPGTREEVIRIIEKWIDGNGDLSTSIFWLSGPAGAGKTAIIQTIAERGIQRKALMANYFFFHEDPTRNHNGSVVATLLYQILQFYPILKERITVLLDKNPLIFDQSIRDQFNYLIDDPVRSVVNDSAYTKRLVLLIDGLDECSPNTKHVQGDLLHALQHLISQQNSPFIALVASRAEPHLVMTFNETGSSIDSIFLDENYHPSDDIRLFVTAEFDRIKRTHHLGQTLDDDWPPKAGVDEIVEVSSGQFAPPAYAMNYISRSAANPAHSLERVLGTRPITKSSPFSGLDALFTYILSQVEDWQSVNDILACQFLISGGTGPVARAMLGHEDTIATLLAPLGLTSSDIQSHLSDLVSVVQYNRETEQLTFYHASLRDFLRDKSRSKSLFIDLELFIPKLAAAHILTISSFHDVQRFCAIFAQVKIGTPPLRNALESWKPWRPETPADLSGGYINAVECTSVFRKLYHEDDNLFYQTILRKWLTWFSDMGLPKDYVFFYDLEASKIWDDIQVKMPIAKVPFWKRVLRKNRRSVK